MVSDIVSATAAHRLRSSINSFAIAVDKSSSSSFRWNLWERWVAIVLKSSGMSLIACRLSLPSR